MTARRLPRLVFVFALVAVAACGGDGASPTTTSPTTTSPASTTTAAVTSTTAATTTTAGTTDTTKPDDNRADGLALAGGFQGGGTPTEIPEAPTGSTYGEFVPVTDETGILSVNVPVEWSDIDGTAWVDNPWGITAGPEGIGLQLTAAPNIEDWTNTWTTPGLFFGASTMLEGSVEELLDTFIGIGEQCTYSGRYEYDDGAYVGALDWWDDCAGAGTAQAVIIARPQGGEFTVMVAITMVTEADVAAADEIVGSFYVNNVTGDGGALDAALDANYGSGELAAGFEPDPQGFEMEAGGDIDVAAYLGSECTGYVTANPDFELVYTGSTGGLLRFFFIAASAGDDTVMVVNDPAGDWWCSDDYASGIVDPSIEFLPALDGTYDIWVGTYESGALIPGSLFITEVDANHP